MSDLEDKTNDFEPNISERVRGYDSQGNLLNSKERYLPVFSEQLKRTSERFSKVINVSTSNYKKEWLKFGGNKSIDEQIKERNIFYRFFNYFKKLF